MQNRRKTLSLTVSIVLAAALAACGGSDDVPSATLEVTPALGAAYGASVTVFNGTTGATLGSGVTGATSGTASIPLIGSTAGSIVVKVTLTAGSSYFDEKLNTTVNITSANTVSLLTALPALPTSTVKSVGVTPLTNMAAKLAGLDPSTSNVIVTPAMATDGAARTVLALGLPTSFNITAAPQAAKSLTTLPTDVYGLLLAEMAKKATTNALDQAKDLVNAASTGSVNSSSKGLTEATAALTAAAAVVNTAKGAGSIATVAPKTSPTQNDVSAAVTAQNTVIAANTTPTGATGGTGASGSR